MKKSVRVILEDYSMAQNPPKGQPKNCYMVGDVWASRPDICSVRILNGKKSIFGLNNGTKDKLIAELSWDDEKLKSDDFIFVHYTRRSLDGRKVPRKERFELLAGESMPAWAEFPAAWARWVEEMHPVAVEWLLAWAKERGDDVLVSKINEATAVSTKKGAWRGWNGVESYLRKEGCLRRFFRHKKTWTSVAAMPVKIALALGWKPTKERPNWIRERVGVLVVGRSRKQESINAK